MGGEARNINKEKTESELRDLEKIVQLHSRSFDVEGSPAQMTNSFAVNKQKPTAALFLYIHDSNV